MRSGAEPGIAQRSDDLTGFHRLLFAHRDRVLPEMRKAGIDPIAVVDRDVIAGCALQLFQVGVDILGVGADAEEIGMPIDYTHDATGGWRQHRVAETEKVVRLQRLGQTGVQQA